MCANQTVSNIRPDPSAAFHRGAGSVPSMRSLWLSAAVACASLLTPAAAASVATAALSVDASAGLRAAQLSLTSALLEQPALLEELCAIPLRGAEPLHHWEAAELHELQWPPLVAAAARDREWIEQLDTELADTGLVDAQFVRSLDAVRRHSYATGAVGTPGSSLCLRTASEAMERLAVPRGRPSEFAAACGWRRNDELLIEEGWANPDPNPDPNLNPKPSPKPIPKPSPKPSPNPSPSPNPNPSQAGPSAPSLLDALVGVK